ncbi:adenine phosphoribosyltransferase [Fulvivirga sp. M361]|uniref:adenine phosphoribosyltransferase n=1 Tax=Fulvivirga sp. M361 TaxID=2594266 RepID=UPI00117B9950|nr:adenine phosphoribosyltransferase [Fulvivirga sp. M361]TRX55983.1 adenine phosphoribosyltransferase [Fulvivirga sp. M361]
MTGIDKIKAKIRDVKDFPKEGIIFKDITPLLLDPVSCDDVLDALLAPWADQKIDAIAAIESRGFFFGMLMANRLGVPFVPVRKVGKLPARTVQYAYELEYGQAVIEIHDDALQKGSNVLIHDDLLATGGTARATAELVQLLEGTVTGFSFVIDLTFLNGASILQKYNKNIRSVIAY